VSRVAEAPEMMTMLQQRSWQRLRFTEVLAPEITRVEPRPPALLTACNAIEHVHSGHEDAARGALLNFLAVRSFSSTFIEERTELSEPLTWSGCQVLQASAT
jgi:hypothetical protein